MVGTKQPNELDVYDMSGNVLEWCFDKYLGYTSSSQINPIIMPDNGRCVVRGVDSVTSREEMGQIEEKEYKNGHYYRKAIEESVYYTQSMHYVKTKGCGFRIVINR